MGKSKAELVEQAVASGVVPTDAEPDDFTVAQLDEMLNGQVVARDRVSATEPIVAPDGHVVLSQEDIDARDQ